MSDLPPTSDKEFWGDAVTTNVPIKRNEVNKRHEIVWEGPYAVCVSCEYRHTMPLDPVKYADISVIESS